MRSVENLLVIAGAVLLVASILGERAPLSVTVFGIGLALVAGLAFTLLRE